MDPFIIILLAVLMTAGLVFVLSYTLAIPTRHILRNLRERNIGDLVWYQIRPESLVSGRARRTPGEQTTAVARFMNGLQGAWWQFANRGVASIVWHMGDDDMLRLYIGIDQSHHDSMIGGLNSLAKDMNCRAEHCQLPELPFKNPSFAFNEVSTPANILKEPVSLGGVARDISAMGVRGAVIFTIEDMTPSESKKTERYIAAGGVISDSGFAHGGLQGNIIGASAIRSSIAAVASDGTYRSSESLLKQAYGSIGTSPVKVNYHSPYRIYAIPGVVAAAFYSMFMLFTALFGAPPYLWIPFLLLGAGTALAMVSGVPIFGRGWIEDRLRKGEVVVPAYMMYGTPKRIRSLIISSDQSPPSTRQVIPLYAAPVAQILSFPDGDATLNIDVDVVPMIGVPAPFDMSARRDYLFCGITGENQAMGVPYSDIEHCIYVAGAPNMGKSNFLELLFGQVARMNTNLQVTPIWVETKGSGSYSAYEVAKVNPRTIFIDAHNPNSTYRLALEGRRLSEGASVDEVIQNCISLVNGLQFAYGQAIADSSREALDFSIRIAMLLSKDEILSLELGDVINADKPNVIRLASLVIAENGYYNVGTKLLAMREEIEKIRSSRNGTVDRREIELSHAIGTLSIYLDNRKDTTSKSAPPANKLSALGNLETLWTPDNRIDVYVNQLPSHFAPIVLNMGPYIIGQDMSGEKVYSSTSQKDARMALLAFNHMIWGYSKARCSGWQEQNKRVVIISDEVKDIAVDSEEVGVDNVVESISKEGRSRGFSLWAASQMPHQVPESVRYEFFSFRTKIWYALPEKHSARSVIDQMPNSTYFAEENIQKLPAGLAVVGEMRQGQRFASPFTMMTPKAETWFRYLDHFQGDTSAAFYAFSDNEMDSVKEFMGLLRR